MYKLAVRGIKLPEIWVVSTQSEIDVCKKEGLPYIIWFGKPERLIKLALFPVLRKKFPGIKWSKILDIKTESGERPVLSRKEVEEQLELASEEQHELIDLLFGEDDEEDKETFLTHQFVCIPGGMDSYAYSESFNDKQELVDFVSGKAGIVNIEELAFLHVLPSFMDDITNNIKLNLETYNWQEGYNKKRGATIGNFDPVSDNKNLIILDISGSIPDGISATMISLAETMRSVANADFILTGSKSYFFENGTALPTPKKMRKMCGYCNEAEMFCQVLLDHVDGNTYDNVIIFGDDDSPMFFQGYKDAVEKMNVTVHEVWHYHTYRQDKECGYGRWVGQTTNAVPHYNTDWCDCMERTLPN